MIPPMCLPRPGFYPIRSDARAAAAVVPLNEWLRFPGLPFMFKVRQIDEGGGA